ncbi:MAG: MmcQ/YjbR family DNA-binding protein [Eubacteriales bacterium]|nr:MmcQ/YjbR family DNA-binding protein [Eubacteriales bacterium]
MNRTELSEYIQNSYGAKPDFPWPKYPGNEVFRHGSNRKWFAIIMDVQKSKLGLPGDDVLQVVNFKCDPGLIGTLPGEKGFFPAYHMNKSSWITVALDGSAEDDMIKMLLDGSFAATAP